MVDVGIGMKLWNSPWCLGLNGKLGLDHWLLLSPLPCCLSACHFSRKHGNFGCCTAQTNEFLLGQEGSSRKQIQNITEMTFPSKYLGIWENSDLAIVVDRRVLFHVFRDVSQVHRYINKKQICDSNLACWQVSRGQLYYQPKQCITAKSL